VNILLFHQHFNTPVHGGPIRSYYLGTALALKGHRVVMITSWDGPSTKLERVDGIEVVYLPIPYDNRFSFYARVWSFLRFIVSAIRSATPYRTFDVCYAISAPLSVAVCARWMKWRHRMPYWFEVGDLWPDAPIQLGYIRNPLVIKWLLAFERSTYQKALGIVALSGPIREAILQKSPRSRVELIPNMSDADFFRPGTRDSRASLPFSSQNRLVISYIGALGAANGLDQLLHCAAECLKENLAVEFIICGDGAMLDSLKESASRQSLTNVSFRGFVNRDGVKALLDATDAVFVSYLPAPILETGCPNKYFDGLAAGKLIIVNFNGWIRNEIEKVDCGFYINPKQPREIVDQLKRFLDEPSRLVAAKTQARKLAEEKYSRKLISERFTDLFSPS